MRGEAMMPLTATLKFFGVGNVQNVACQNGGDNRDNDDENPLRPFSPPVSWRERTSRTIQG